MNTLIDDRESPDSPKKFILKQIDVDLAMSLNKQWHSRLPETVKGNLLRNRNYIFFGAFYKNNYFAAAIWTTPVAANRLRDGQNCLELRRLAISDDAPKYTATWMISKMIKVIRKELPSVHTLVSYQDTGVHTGTIYAASNWVCDQESKNYIPWSNEKRIRKSKVQSDSPKKRWIFKLKEPTNENSNSINELSFG